MTKHRGEKQRNSKKGGKCTGERKGGGVGEEEGV